MSAVLHATAQRSSRRSARVLAARCVVVLLTVATLSVTARAGASGVGYPTPDSDRRTAAAALSGVKTVGGPAGVKAFEQWRGRTVGLVHIFAPGDTWQDISLPTTWLTYWSADRGKILLSLPMLPARGTASLAAGARGDYDTYFRRAARHLVSAGMSRAVIRVGWELNGGWFRWSARTDPEAYAAFYRRIVHDMRAVNGASFRFVWSVSNGYYGWNPREAFPGRRYVNFIGVGLYDCWWRHADASAAERWDSLVRGPGGVPAGLRHWTRFAEQVRRPLSLPEWGLVNANAQMCGGSGGGGDDPYFVRKVHGWVVGHGVAFEAYFDTDAPDGSHAIDGGAFPNAAQRYRALFGGG